MKLIQKLILPLLAFVTVACGGLSDQAKEIVGNYYIPELSQEEPILELRDDGTCTIRAIKPGVLTYSVQGEWNVADGTLTAQLDPEKVDFTGDSTLIGDISKDFKRRIVSHSDLALELEKDGVTYIYQKRYN